MTGFNWDSFILWGKHWLRKTPEQEENLRRRVEEARKKREEAESGTETTGKD